MRAAKRSGRRISLTASVTNVLTLPYALALAIWAASIAPPAARAETGDASAALLPSPELILPEIEVLGRRPPAAGALFAATVLRAASLGPSPARDVSDLLPETPGAFVRRSGGPGAPSLLSLRGAPPEGVLILLDGERVSGAQGGGVDLALFPTEALSSLEVVRGGASVIHGANAIGGVVNLVRFPDTWAAGSRVGFEIASLGTVAGVASHSRAVGSGWLRILARGFRSDGDFLFDDARRGGQELRLNAGGSSRLVDLIGEQRIAPGRLRASVRVSSSAGGSPGLSEFPTPEARREDRRAAAHARLDAGAMMIAASLSRGTRAYRDPAAPLGAIDARHEETSGSIRGEVRAERGGFRGTGGFEARRERLSSTTDGDPSRDTGALYGVGARRLGRITATAAGRLDALTAFRAEVSWRGAAAIDAGPFRARAAVGTSFRPPSFDDLFWPASGFAIGNPDLRPERATERDAGVAWESQRAGASAALDLFAHDVTDLIQWNLGPSGLWRPTNIGRARVRGIEATLRWSGGLAAGLPALEATGSLLASRDATGDPATGGRYLTGRARRLAWARARRPIGAGLELETAWRWAGAVPRNAANTKSIAGYGIGSVALTARPRHDVALRAEIENVTGASYEDFHGFPLPGRLLRFAIAWGHDAGAPPRGVSALGRGAS